MMVSVERLRSLLHSLVIGSDWHFAVGVRVRFANPTLLYQTYPEDWINYYNENGLVFVDPTVRWGLTHTGVCDWSSLEQDDDAGVIAKAASYGLRHGIAVSTGDAASRSLGFFCHEQRPLVPQEISLAVQTVQDIHDATAHLDEASEAELTKLRNLNVGLRQV